MDELNNLLSIPTAPFRERQVLEYLAGELQKAKVPFFFDSIGNLVAGASRERDYKRKLALKRRSPLRVMIAHTDHPGFHGRRWRSSGELEFVWHGGSPIAHLEGARVWLADDDGLLTSSATIASVQMHGSGRKAIAEGVLIIRPAHDESERLKHAERIFGGFAFRAPVWSDGDRIYTKAADDLIGCYAILETVKRLKKRKDGAFEDFLGLFTRAEEVGFIGAIGHFEHHLKPSLRREMIAVSLETSRALPGAEFGKGPVVRLGDRATVFSPGPTEVLRAIAEKTLPGAYQRRIMDGGSCEATVAVAMETPAIGISVPLGNYHNQSFEGGPDSRGADGPAPEFVDRRDIERLLALCGALFERGIDWKNAWRHKRKDFDALFGKYRSLLLKHPIPGSMKTSARPR